MEQPAHLEFDERGDVLKPESSRIHWQKPVMVSDLTKTLDECKSHSGNDSIHMVLESSKSDADTLGTKEIHREDFNSSLFQDDVNHDSRDICDEIPTEKPTDICNEVVIKDLITDSHSELNIQTCNAYREDKALNTKAQDCCTIEECLNEMVNEISGSNDGQVQQQTVLMAVSSEFQTRPSGASPTGSFADSLEDACSEASECYSPFDHLPTVFRSRSAEIPRLSAIVENSFTDIPASPDVLVDNILEEEHSQSFHPCSSSAVLIGSDQTATSVHASTEIEFLEEGECQQDLISSTMMGTEEASCSFVNVYVNDQNENTDVQYSEKYTKRQDKPGESSHLDDHQEEYFNIDHTYAGPFASPPAVKNIEQIQDENANVISASNHFRLEEIRLKNLHLETEDIAGKLESCEELGEYIDAKCAFDELEEIEAESIHLLQEPEYLVEDPEQEDPDETIVATCVEEEDDDKLDENGRSFEEDEDTLTEDACIIGNDLPMSEEQSLKEYDVLKLDPDFEESVDFYDSMLQTPDEMPAEEREEINHRESLGEDSKPKICTGTQSDPEICSSKDKRLESAAEYQKDAAIGYGSFRFQYSQSSLLETAPKPKYSSSRFDYGCLGEEIWMNSDRSSDLSTPGSNSKYFKERFSDAHAFDSGQEKNQTPQCLTTSDWTVEVNGLSSPEVSPEYKYQRWSAAGDFSPTAYYPYQRSGTQVDDYVQKTKQDNSENFTRIKYTRDYLMKFADCLLAYSFPDSLRPFSKTMELPLKQLPVSNPPQPEPSIVPPVNAYPGMDHILFYQNVTQNSSCRRISSRS